MRRTLDDLLRFFGIAQGVAWVVGSIGAGAIVFGVVAAVFGLVVSLPWWAVVPIAIGAFLVTIALLSAVAAWIAGVRASPLTPMIEEGRRLRGRLAKVTSEDPDGTEKRKWQERIDEWSEESARLIHGVAPHRVTGFLTDFVWTGKIMPIGRPEDDLPGWVRDHLVELDDRLDRLEMIRVSI